MSKTVKSKLSNYLVLIGKIKSKQIVIEFFWIVSVRQYKRCNNNSKMNTNWQMAQNGPYSAVFDGI